MISLDDKAIHLHPNWKHVNPLRKKDAIEGIKNVSKWLNSLNLTTKKVELAIMPHMKSQGIEHNFYSPDTPKVIFITARHGTRRLDKHSQLKKDNGNRARKIAGMVAAGLPLYGIIKDVDIVNRIVDYNTNALSDEGVFEIHYSNAMVLIHEYLHFVEVVERSKRVCVNDDWGIERYMMERCSYILSPKLLKLYQIYNTMKAGETINGAGDKNRDSISEGGTG